MAWMSTAPHCSSLGIGSDTGRHRVRFAHLFFEERFLRGKSGSTGLSVSSQSSRGRQQSKHLLPRRGSGANSSQRHCEQCPFPTNSGLRMRSLFVIVAPHPRIFMCVPSFLVTKTFSTLKDNRKQHKCQACHRNVFALKISTLILYRLFVDLYVSPLFQETKRL